MNRAGSVWRMIRSPFVIVVGLVALWFIITFLVWPNGNLLVQTFFPDGQLSLRAVEKVTSSSIAMRSLGNSFILAFSLSLTVNAVGLFIVLVTRYFDIKGSRILWLGYATTLIYSGIVLVAGYQSIYGADGIVTKILLRFFPEIDPSWFSGFLAVLIVQTLAMTTNHLLFVSSAVAKIDAQTVEAAVNMGASNWTILRRIVLPMLRPMLFAVTVLTFLGGLSALSAPQILGGRDFQTIAPIVLSLVNSGTSRDVAALLALVLGLATIVLLAIMARVERGGTYFSLSRVSSDFVKQKIRNPVMNIVVHGAAYLLFAIYVLPVVLIVLYSFQSSKAIANGDFELSALTLDNYARVLSQASGFAPFVISILYAGLASLITVLGLVFVARIITKYRNPISTALEYLLHIPWILPTTMITLGLIVSFDAPNPLVGGSVLTGTTVILLIAYVIANIPFTLRLLKAAFAGVNDTYEDAALLMGAKTLLVFRRILLPAILPTVLAIGALNFGGLLADYDTSIYLANPLFQPLGPVIKAATEGDTNLDGRANNFVYTVLLMIIIGITTYLVYGRGTRTGSRGRRQSRRAAAPGPDTIRPDVAVLLPVSVGSRSMTMKEQPDE